MFVGAIGGIIAGYAIDKAACYYYTRQHNEQAPPASSFQQYAVVTALKVSSYSLFAFGGSFAGGLMACDSGGEISQSVYLFPLWSITAATIAVVIKNTLLYPTIQNSTVKAPRSRDSLQETEYHRSKNHSGCYKLIFRFKKSDEEVEIACRVRTNNPEQDIGKIFNTLRATIKEAHQPPIYQEAVANSVEKNALERFTVTIETKRE